MNEIATCSRAVILVFQIPSLDMEHVYYDLIPNLFTLQALYSDLGGFSPEKKNKPSNPLDCTEGRWQKRKDLKEKVENNENETVGQCPRVRRRKRGRENTGRGMSCG